MPLFIAALIGALVSALGTIVGRVLVSLGIGYVVFSGVDFSITFARDVLIARISASAAQTIAVASTLKIGVCVSMLTSALATRLTISGLTGGTLRKMVLK